MAFSFDEIKTLEQERKLLVQKTGDLRNALLLETDASRRFAYEQELLKLEGRKTAIDADLAQAYDLGTDSGKERLREKIKNLRISEEMGRVHLVNCNRHDLRHRFEEGFDMRTTAGYRNHFYMLSACPTQMPPSLGERMVYELLGDLLEDGKQAVHCRFNPVDHDRIKLEKLPIGYSLEKSKSLFQEFCAKWFEWDDKLSFEAALQANLLPMAKLQYSILPFKLDKKDWKPFFGAYLDWIITQLNARTPGGPTLLVFVVLYMRDIHETYDPATMAVTDPNAAEIIQSVEMICQKHGNADHYFPLLPVEEADLISWFNDLGENNNARIQPVVDTLVESLPQKETTQYRHKKNGSSEEARLLNMDRIELVQEIVFDLYNK